METSEVAKTTVLPRSLERSVPEGNLIGNFNKLLYMFRLVTKKSVIPVSTPVPIPELKAEWERPLSSRATRAQLYKEVKSTSKTDKEARKNIFAEVHDRDEIARQYLTQGKVVVHLPNLGEQSARHTIITPPNSRKTPETDSRPPIFLIPGISNDIDCVGSLVQEIPFMGRKVIIVGMPESIMGQVTPEFAQAVSKSSSFSPHTDFFKGAINALIGEGNQVELWGHSAGGPIIADILSDPKFQEKVTDAVLLCPSSSSNIPANVLNLGILNELRNLVSSNLPKYTLSTQGELPDRMDVRKLKGKVFDAMLKKVCTVAEGWRKARVRDGGRIIVYSGRRDKMTRSNTLFRNDKNYLDFLKKENPQIEVIDDPSGYHSTPLIEPQKVIKEVFNKQAA